LTIMCMNSIPPRMMRAQRKFLKPSIARVRRLMARSVVLLDDVV
jgi:hypothetical protein